MTTPSLTYSQKITPPMNADDFMASHGDNPDRIQLINGEVVFPEMANAETMPPEMANYIHQAAIKSLHVSMLRLEQETNLGKFYTAPNQLNIESTNYYQPDIFFVANDNPRCQLMENDVWRGVPDLVVEILFKSTAKYDRLDKFDVYEKNGVREYWIIDPEIRLVEVYLLGEDGLYHRRAYADGGQFNAGVLPQLTIEVSDLFPNPSEQDNAQADE